MNLEQNKAEKVSAKAFLKSLISQFSIWTQMFRCVVLVIVNSIVYIKQLDYELEISI